MTMSEPAPVRVLVVDDQAPFRMAAKFVIMRAVEEVAELAPDLVLMDINMGGIDGIEATRRIKASAPTTTVFLCSTYQLSDLPSDATTSGARAYVNKEELSPDLLQRLWHDHHGDGLLTM
jgi:two-component system invasion response regulator UvrY